LPESICSRLGTLDYNLNFNYEFIDPTADSPFDVGIASSAIAPTFVRYHYDAATKTCETFTW